MPEKYTGGGGGQGFTEVWHSRHLSDQNLVWAILGLTEQLDQKIILSLAHDLRALPLCYFYKFCNEFSCVIWNKFMRTGRF